MRSRFPADLGDRLLGLLPTVATAAAEGAWIAVVYAAIQLGFAGQPVVLGPWAFIAAVCAGIVVGRRVHGRAALPAVVATVATATLFAWIADPAVRERLAETASGSAFGLNAAAWLAGLAVWRGTRHADPASDDLVVGSLLTWGIPGLAVPWLIGMAAANRQAFVDAALPETVLFLAAGLIAVGLTRLDALGRAVGVDWRRNRTWIALLGATVLAVIAIGIPVALLLGASAGGIARTALGPVGTVVDAGSAALNAVGGAINQVIGPVQLPNLASNGPASGPASAFPAPVAIAIAIAIAILFVVGLRLMGRMVGVEPRPAPFPLPPVEERHIALRLPSLRLPSAHLPRAGFRRARPHSATDAYLALMAALADDPQLARGPAETPAAHARRLRMAGRGSLALDLLAADFQIERYADGALTAPEVRRAIRRSHGSRSWRRAGSNRPPGAPSVVK